MTYSLVAEEDTLSLFQIDPTTGEVFTVGSIDREMQDSYQVELVASDGGNPMLSSSSSFSISISDINDHQPVFSSVMYEFSVMENAQPGVVGTVMASDGDRDQNAALVYSLIDSVPEFFINSVTGELSTLSALDREEREEYVFTVMATDSGSTPLSATATVRVSVLDVNDIAPEFSAPLYNVNVSEDTPVGSLLATLEAVDQDNGPNGEIVFQIISGGDTVFSLDPQLGELRYL